MTRRTTNWSKRDLIVTSLKDGVSFTKELNLIAGAKSKENQLVPSSQHSTD